MNIRIFFMFLIVFILILVVFQNIEGFSAYGVAHSTEGMNPIIIYVIIGICVIGGVFGLVSRSHQRKLNNNYSAKVNMNKQTLGMN